MAMLFFGSIQIFITFLNGILEPSDATVVDILSDNYSWTYEDYIFAIRMEAVAIEGN